MKYKYNDKVKVIKGFYKNMEGTIKSTVKLLFVQREYFINFNNEQYNNIFVKEKDIVLIKEK